MLLIYMLLIFGNLNESNPISDSESCLYENTIHIFIYICITYSEQNLLPHTEPEKMTLRCHFCLYDTSKK